MRKVIAILEVDDDMAIAEDMGTLDYLDTKCGWLISDGVILRKAKILDDDDEYDAKAIELASQIFNEEENPVATDEDLVGILGQLLDEHEDDVEMSAKVRQAINDVYGALCVRINNW